MNHQRSKQTNKMKTKLTLVMIVTLLCAGCTTTKVTTNPDGTTTTTRVPDPVKTEKVKAVAETVSTMALRRALARFPQDSDEIAKYARAVGAVFCTMQSTKQFSPEVLEAAVAQLTLPLIKDTDAQTYIADARDVMRLVYRQFWADRFSAELPPEQWPAVVADIFCNSIDQALRDSGRAGVK